MSEEKEHKEHEPTIEELIMGQDARKAAAPIAAFHKHLITEGMSEETARQVTSLYTRRILFGQYTV
jgi:hypothetical protein